MSILRSSFIAAALALSAVAAQAATVVPLTQDGSWYAFTVDAGSAQSGGLEWIDTDYDLTGGAGDFKPLSFTFTVVDKAILRIVDGLFVGDTFGVSVASGSGSQQLSTSAVSAQTLDDTYSLLNYGYDFDAAFADATNVSRLETVLSAGTYTVTGVLTQSVQFLNASGLYSTLNSTAGGLSVTAVPEPTGLALVLAAAGVVGLVSRRRTRG